MIGRLTDENLQAIASVYALPEPVRRKRYGTDDQVIGHLARSCGVSAAFIRRAKRDRRVRNALYANVIEALDYLFPTLVYYQVELAMEGRDTKAFRSLAEILGKIKQGGGVNVSVAVNGAAAAPRDGGLAEDQQNFQYLRELKALQQTGELDRLLNAIPAEFEMVPVPSGTISVPEAEKVPVGQPQP